MAERAGQVPVGEAPMRSAILLALTETWPHDDPWCSTCAGRMVDAITEAITALPVEQRMEAMGMERVVPASSSGMIDAIANEMWFEVRRG